jgi:hypothetical protein
MLRLSRIKRLLVVLIVFTALAFLRPAAIFAGDIVKVEMEPRPCSVAGGGCPTGLTDVYNNNSADNPYSGDRCVATFEEFKVDPLRNHFWIDDPEITTQGKADERARQFLYWTLNKSAIDSHPALTSIWGTTRNIAYFLVVLMAAIMGVGFIIGQRTNFDFKIKVWPSVIKIGLTLLYITFSAVIVLLLIQLSELLMKFFIESVGGTNLYNIYFSAGGEKKNYIDFVGCRDLNYNVQEAARAELFILKLTNITYYAMGAMIILRKIILWFMLFVSPFLAILLSFSLIRNIGLIWIGVFFQWLFYGPLFALFLGALAKIWSNGIPYPFDFSRTSTIKGYVYPTGINIIYGGPAQALGALNNGNYIDTFAEYVITLIMLWAVIFFPWWLLRMFRDYCCDGIYAMKNILLSIYDSIRGLPSSQPPVLPVASLKTALKIPQAVEIPVRLKLETVEEIKKTQTEEVKKSLNLHVSKLTDIAHVETNRETRETVKRNLEYLANPTRAQTPTERQKYMNLRTELFNRAIKNDQVAKQILSTISTSPLEKVQRKEEIVRTVPQAVPVTHVVSYKVKMPKEKVGSLSASLATSASGNNTMVSNLAQTSQVTSGQVLTLLNSFKQNVNNPPLEVLGNISKETGLERKKVIEIITNLVQIAKLDQNFIREMAQKEGVNEEDVKKVIDAHVPIITEPEKNIEQVVFIPSTIAIEDYENVKRMWIQQYEKGEVPVMDNIKSRSQWVDQDIVFITNTLNKLLSPAQNIRQQGLDDVGYILPIFLINNMKCDELVVYLKAKLEAAKTVKTMTDKEKEITAKLKTKAEEQFVDVPAQHKEEEKTMTMEQTLNQNPKTK